MKISSDILLAELKEQTKVLISSAEEFKLQSHAKLNFKNTTESWSILECIAHINLYSNFYLVEFNRCLDFSKNKTVPLFQSGWFGNYSANSMLPTKKKMSKMKTFKHMNPIYSKVNKVVLDDFINEQNDFLLILDKCKKVNLNKTRCKLTIPVITFKLGDALRFYVNHNQRHIVQAKNLLKITI